MAGFGVQNALVALSLAKTGAKAVDWTGVVVTAVRSTALQTGRGTLSCVGSAHICADTHVGNGVGQSEVKVRVMLVLL